MIGVSALFGAGIDGGSNVVIGRAGDHGAVGVGGVAIEGGVDHGVGAAGGGAAINVIADCLGGRGPSEVDGVLGWRYAGAGQRLHGGRV